MSSHQGWMPLLEALPLGALIVDRSGRIVAANAIALRIARQTRQQIEGRPFFEAFAGIDDLEKIETAFFENVGSGSMAGIFDTRLPGVEDSDPVPTALHLRSIRQTDEPCALILFEPILDENQLHRAVRELEGIGLELARIKHEISNPLMGLIGSALLLEEDADLSEATRRRVAWILNEGRRIEASINVLGKLAGSKGG